MASPALDDLFPIPPPRVSPLIPERWPGVSAASTNALLETVKADYEKFHVFFNDMGFHKSVFATYFDVPALMYMAAIPHTISSRCGHLVEMRM
jgi:hypothetical protein